MAKTEKKSPTIFYWLSLVSAAAILVMMFVPWFRFQATSFGIHNASGIYGLTQIEDFLKTASAFVPVDSDSWVNTAAVGVMMAIAALEAVHILWTLITIRRNPPRGILPSAAAILAVSAFFVIHGKFSAYIDRELPPDFAHIEFHPTIVPYLILMLAVATVVFSLLNRQESRALYAVRHPRDFVFPPENPEPV